VPGDSGAVEGVAINLGGVIFSGESRENIKDLKEIKNLYLANSKITDASIPVLKDLEKLAVLNISSTGITDKGVKELMAAIPGCYVTK
jgi:citrate lyase alpha subunit